METQVSDKVIEYLTSVPKYGWRNGTVDQWVNYENSLNTWCWNEISKDMSVNEKVDIFLSKIEGAVESSFENLKDKKVEKN